MSTRIFFFPLVLFACSEQAIQGTNGGQGNDGLDCWDADGNGEADAAEDVNGDGVVDTADCLGTTGQDGSGQNGQDGRDGQDCWDTNGNGEADPEEDVNADGRVDVWDCWGQDFVDTGDTGGVSPGSGEPYFSSVQFVSDVMMEEFCARYSVVYGGVTVTVSEDGDITSLDGLSCLEYVSNDFHITLNTGSGISEVVLPNLEYAGELTIYAAESVSLDFPVLASTGKLALSSDGISAVSVDSLTEVNGTVDISQTHLPNLDAFASLVTIEANFYLGDNDLMTDLTGMYGVTSIGGGVSIYANSLFTDDVAWELIEAIGESNIGGSVSIYSNGSR